jgi:hypothetical protein
LGPGCAAHGEAVYDALKREVAARGLVQDAWVTKTHCLGICPKVGATVARYLSSPDELGTIFSEVDASEVGALFEDPARRERPQPTLDELARELDAMEELQNRKVLDLAKRLRPGLTHEDVQNPHDFPELGDPDWQYADGVRAGIASAKSALAALVAARPPRTSRTRP